MGTKTQKSTAAFASIALLHATVVTPGLAQSLDNCTALANGVLLANCEQANAGDTAGLPIGVNTEPSLRRIDNSDGFVLSVDGQTIDADPAIEDTVRVADLALAQANIRITADGLDVKPRLDIETVDMRTTNAAGSTMTLRSRTNYPDFIDRGELRLFVTGAGGNTRFTGTVPIESNGFASIVLPEGEDVRVVYRVYDADGRYNETEAVSVSRLSRATIGNGIETGTDRTAVSNMPVNGGAVTVSASEMEPGARLVTLGESVVASTGGRAVIQRILRPGDYAISVAVQETVRPVRIVRDISVPGGEWFYFAVADLTLAASRTDGGDIETETRGRLTYYIDGETASGVEVTSSLDTGDQPIEELFQRLDEKDPAAVLRDLDPEDGYLTYGDDSSMRDNTPTSGKVYLRIARDESFAVWGDYKSTVSGSGYIRNERTLYGAQVVANTRGVTAQGDTRASAELYAAQPDQLVGREVFRGTGGSVYFLSSKDVTPGTETLTIETRDASTNRVLDRRTLVAGRDYDINYLQGVIVLKSPLAGSGTAGLIQSNPGGDVVANLVAQYEYTPTATDVDGMAFGGRAEIWANDDIRLGVSGTKDTTGVDDLQSAGVDLRYRVGDNSYVQLDYAQSEGTAYGTSSSATGGLIFIEGAPVSGSGEAYKVEMSLDLEDLGMSRAGTITAYAEERTEGFTTLDVAVDATTGDERLMGFSAGIDATDEALGYRVYADLYENEVGDETTTLGGEVTGRITPNLSFAVALETLDETTGGTSGDRIDAAAELSYALTEETTVRAFAQSTVERNALDAYERFGLGLAHRFRNGWSLKGEVSDGTGGVGAELAAAYERDGNTYYFGYEVDPGRALDAGLSGSDDGGRYVVGGRNQVTEDLAMFAENTYDLLGETQSLTSAYGAEYQASEALTFTGSVKLGNVDVDGEIFDQTALTFGLRYDSERTKAAARLELRRDEGSVAGENRDADTVALVANLSHKFSDDQRMLLGIKAIDTQSDESDILNGELYDLTLGYALRPVDNEQLNILASYRYLKDDYGQEIDGLPGAGPVQESHVASIDVSYDLNRNWTLGAKLGGRLTESADTRGDPLSSNDAWIAIANARYNLVGNWDVLLEGRHFEAVDSGFTETSGLAAVYRHIGDNAKIGVGYNFGSFSDDLTDLTTDNEGAFISIIAKY